MHGGFNYFSLDGFNDELSAYVTWFEFINLQRLPRLYERQQRRNERTGS